MKMVVLSHFKHTEFINYVLILAYFFVSVCFIYFGKIQKETGSDDLFITHRVQGRAKYFV